MSELFERLQRGIVPSRRVLVSAALVIVAFALGALVARGCGASETTPTAPVGLDVADDAAVPDETVWTCAMHPQIRRAEPGNCPICGMTLIPVGRGVDDDADDARVTLSERAKTLSKIRTSAVRRMAHPAADLRLLGRVEADETASKTVTAWVSGRVDRLHVNATGARVRSGQTIATLYSPETFAAHQDLIAARRQVERLRDASETARNAAQAALDASRERLKLLGVTAAAVREMERAESPSRSLPIRSPFAGTVIERMVAEGAYVQTGEPLYRIADLSRVWVQLDAYERNLARIRVGQEVVIHVDALPDDAFEGRVAFVDPTIDAARRTTRVRVEVPNPEGELRPGMFAQGAVRSASSDDVESPLVVPHTAPLFTGRRSLVYVEVPDAERPTYEARVVRLGPRTGDVYPVVAGLEEGERVVTRGTFVIDADLQIRGGSSMMTRTDDDRVGEGEVIAMSDARRRALAPVVESYLQLQTALAADDLERARMAASTLAESASRVDLGLPSAQQAVWEKLEASLDMTSRRISYASSLEGARGPFEALSGHVKALLARFGNPMAEPLHAAFCPMAGKTGSEWIQRGEDIDNPYFGATMRECGELREQISPKGRLPPSAPTPPKAAPKSPRQAPTPPRGHQH
jgi:membrane fusion protein, copper/silver efflux system